VAEWEQLSPPVEALKYYGSWPDAELEIDVPAAL
jgi:hypothetical protein